LNEVHICSTIKIARMSHQIATDKKLDTGIHNRRCVSWNSKLRSTKSKPEAEAFASAQKSVQETSFHCLPKLISGKVVGKQAKAGSIRGATWDVLENKLDVRINGAGNELNAPMPTVWGEPEAEVEKPMNGSVKPFKTPRSALWDELEAEIKRRMSGWLEELKEPGSIPTDERETPLSSKKGESQSSLVEAPEKKCEPPGRSHVDEHGQQTCKKTVVNSDAKTPNSEKGPPLDKKRNKLPMGGTFWEKIWTKRLKKTDSKSTMSPSSSTEIDTSKSFDSKSSSTKRVWPLRSLNFIKSTNTDEKGISLPTEIGTSSEKTRMLSMEPETEHSHSSKEESWLQQTIKKRDQTWLKQAQIAIKEAKKNATSSEPVDKCSSSITLGSETSEASETSSDSDYTYMAPDVLVDGDYTEIDNLINWLTCNESMVETEPDLSRFDNPRGMVVGGKKGMCVKEL
jgi:hypothetical protein